ncbi:MAG: TRAP transporter substrate-binding protein [Lachnospiraceae bacterium]|nr:TRAP transporter substrate-binding protein [Lachnospiraceae bacterium]
MKKKVLSLLLSVGMVAGLLAGCGDLGSGEAPTADDVKTEEPAVNIETTSKDAEVIIRISNGSAATAPFCVAQDTVFKPEIEEASDGKIAVEVYYSNQLGNDTTSTEALRSGDLEMNNTSTAPLVGLVPELAVFDIPFLFSSYEQADYVIDNGLGEYLSNKIADKGIYVIAWNENGFRNLTTVEGKEVHTPDDLKGLKIRTMENQYHMSAWSAMGASPTPINGSEIYTSLQSGVVDGQENPIPNFYAQQIHEVSPCITLTEHIYSPMLLCYSKTLFDKLTEEQQKIVRDAGANYTIAEREENRRQSDDLQAQLDADEKYTVIVLSEEEKQPFKDLTTGLWDEVGKAAGDEVMTMLNDLLAESTK